LVGLPYLPSDEAVKELLPTQVSVKVTQRDVLAEGLDTWLANRTIQLQPIVPGQLYGMLRMDPAFGLKKHESMFVHIDFLIISPLRILRLHVW
jgi:hypothetical protein